MDLNRNDHLANYIRASSGAFFPRIGMLNNLNLGENPNARQMPATRSNSNHDLLSGMSLNNLFTGGQSQYEDEQSINPRERSGT